MSDSMAAGPWCFDETKAPSNIHLLICAEGEKYVAYLCNDIWFCASSNESIAAINGLELDQFKVDAWAEIIPPESGKDDDRLRFLR